MRRGNGWGHAHSSSLFQPTPSSLRGLLLDFPKPFPESQSKPGPGEGLGSPGRKKNAPQAPSGVKGKDSPGQGDGVQQAGAPGLWFINVQEGGESPSQARRCQVSVVDCGEGTCPITPTASHPGSSNQARNPDPHNPASLPPLGEGRRPPPWPRCGRAGPSVGAAGSLAARPCPLCPVSPPPRCEGARVGLWSEGCAVPGHTQSQGGGCAPSRLFEAALGRVPWSRSGPVTRASCLGAQNSPAWGGPSGREVRQLP